MNRIAQGKGSTTVCVVCGKNEITIRYNPTCSEECQNRYRGVPDKEELCIHCKENLISFDHFCSLACKDAYSSEHRSALQQKSIQRRRMRRRGK